MKSETLIALGILFFVVCGCLSHTLLESFRGTRRWRWRSSRRRRSSSAEEVVVEAEVVVGVEEAEAEDICIDLGRRNHGGWYRRAFIVG